jgi:curli production assembly/transport component CsgE
MPRHCLLEAVRAIVFVFSLGIPVCNVFAQGSEPPVAPGTRSGSDAQPLISLPTTPTPSPVGKARPDSRMNPAPLSGNTTVNRSSTLDGSTTLQQRRNGRAADVANQDPLSDALGGVVTTDTVTLVGQDFYTAFTQAWDANPLSARYIVSVHERPSARYGSLVWVEYQQRRVFQAFLPIARANIRPIAENAAALAFQNVMQADLTRLLFHEADMASDEL